MVFGGLRNGSESSHEVKNALEVRRIILKNRISKMLDGLNPEDLSKRWKDAYPDDDINPYKNIFDLKDTAYDNMWVLEYRNGVGHDGVNMLNLHFSISEEWVIDYINFFQEPENMPLEAQVELYEGLFKFLLKLFPEKIIESLDNRKEISKNKIERILKGLTPFEISNRVWKVSDWNKSIYLDKFKLSPGVNPGSFILTYGDVENIVIDLNTSLWMPYVVWNMSFLDVIPDLQEEVNLYEELLKFLLELFPEKIPENVAENYENNESDWENDTNQLIKKESDLKYVTVELNKRKSDLEYRIGVMLHGLTGDDISNRRSAVYPDVVKDPYVGIFWVYPDADEFKNICHLVYEDSDHVNGGRLLFDLSKSDWWNSYQIEHTVLLKQPEDMSLVTEVWLLEGLFWFLSKLYPERDPEREIKSNNKVKKNFQKRLEIIGKKCIPFKEKLEQLLTGNDSNVRLDTAKSYISHILRGLNVYEFIDKYLKSCQNDDENPYSRLFQWYKYDDNPDFFVFYYGGTKEDSNNKIKLSIDTSKSGVPYEIESYDYSKEPEDMPLEEEIRLCEDFLKFLSELYPERVSEDVNKE